MRAAVCLLLVLVLLVGTSTRVDGSIRCYVCGVLNNLISADYADCSAHVIRQNESLIQKFPDGHVCYTMTTEIHEKFVVVRNAMSMEEYLKGKKNCPFFKCNIIKCHKDLCNGGISSSSPRGWMALAPLVAILSAWTALGV